MTTLTSSVDIARFQLCALKGAVKLEAKGMKRRGRSATTIVRQMFKVPVSVSREELVKMLEREIEEMQ